MNERDRLAADLHKIGVGCGGLAGACPQQGYHYWLADRLLDLGWTRLDEKRLARALVTAAESLGWPSISTNSAPRIAAAQAKAYLDDEV